jgi:hypothetical protein
MKFSKIILIIFLLISTSLVMKSFGQSFKTIGIRGGSTSGITYKHYVGEDVGFELIGSFRNKGYFVTGLYEYHVPSASLYSKQLKFYYGFGAHVGIYRKLGNCRVVINNDGNEAYDCNQVLRPTVGFDAIFGAEYRLASYPILLGIDYKPYLSVFGPYKFGRGLFDIGLTAKYIF